MKLFARNIIHDRRRIKPMPVLLTGVMIGLFFANPLSLLAQGASLTAWTQPPVVMSILGVLLSIGGARQMVIDDRRRLASLEAETVKRETFAETMKRIDGTLVEIRNEMHLWQRLIQQ